MTTAEQTWDLLVIGGGTAGIVGAKTAARLGARVVLVERDRPGGDCLWTGCVPSKSLLASARAAADARRAGRLGVRADAVGVDFPAVMAHLRDAISTIEPSDSPQALREAGVHVLTAEARFTSARTVALADGRTLRFHSALLATGASPTILPVPGLADAEPWTSESIWDLTELPRRLVVVGGGAIGSELGQGFARLGSDVTIVESGPRILSKEDPDAAAVVHRALEADGVRILTGHRLAGVTGSRRDGGEVELGHDDGRTAVTYDALLVAVGRTSRTHGLDLAAAGIELGDKGTVRVDPTLRTSNPRVWAAGDVTNHPRFTHLAGMHGSLAATNAVLGLRRSVDLAAVPRVTFTDPEVAAVGAATWSGSGDEPRTVTRRHEDVDRAVTEGTTAGFARLALGRRHRVVGATVVGPRAGESLGELVLAVRKKLNTGDLAGTTHPYPTYDDGPWNAAIADVQARLDAPLVQALTHGVTIVRRGLSRWRD